MTSITSKSTGSSSSGGGRRDHGRRPSTTTPAGSSNSIHQKTRGVVHVDTPMLHLILEPCKCMSFLQPFFRALYQIRWYLSYPLQTRLMPHWIPYIPAFHRILHLTIGEVLLALPLLLWSLQSYHYAYITPNVDKTGDIASYVVFLSFVTASKSNSIFSFLFGIPFERMIPFHALATYASIVLGVFHTYAAFQYDGTSIYAHFRDDADLGKFLIDGKTNASGTALLACMIGLVGLSMFPLFRRLFFNLWLYSHMVLAVGVLICLFLHGVNTAVFVTLWWGLDLFTRYGIMASCRYRTKAQLRPIGTRDRQAHEPAIEISFPKPVGFDYQAGQFVQLSIPKLSIFEFHPLSLSSAPHEDYVTLHVRQLGDWTTRLVALGETETEICIEGPYGSSSINLDRDGTYQHVLCVSGGIGVTPCQGIGKSLLHQHIHEGRKLQNLKFVWAVRDAKYIRDIPPLGQELVTLQQREPQQQNGGCGEPADVQVDIYCTRQQENHREDEEQGQDMAHHDAALQRRYYNYHQGRPDLDAILEACKQTALEQKSYSIAVFGCGPASLMRDLEVACRRHSASVVGCGGGGAEGDPAVFFDLHTESFEF